MGWLDRLFRMKPSTQAGEKEQAIIIALDGTSLPDEIYEQYDTSTLEDLLSVALGEIGECDGAEHGPGGSRIYIYGADAEAMFNSIESVLREYPLAAGARVTIRSGPPGARQRDIRLHT